MASDALAALTPAERAALRGRLTALLAGDGTPAADPATLADARGDMVAAILAERPAPVPGTNAEQYLGLETDPARRVVITGMGVITAAGLNVDTFWDSIVAGRSGVVPITRFDPAAYPSRIAAQINGFDPGQWIDRKEARRMSRPTQIIVAAAHQALADSGLPIPADGADDVGVFIGSGTTSLPETEDAMRSIVKGGGPRLSPLFVGMVLPNMPGGQLGIQFRLRGPNARPRSPAPTPSSTWGWRPTPPAAW